MCYSPPSFLVIWNSKIIFAKNLHERPLRPYLWSRDVTMAKTSILRSNKPRANKPSILLIFMCYSHTIFFGDHDFEIIFAKNLHARRLSPYIWSGLVTTAKTSHRAC